MGGYLGTAETLGRRTAEMHLALAADSTKPAFAPEPFSKEDVDALVADAIAQAHKALQTLDAPAQPLPPGVAEGAGLLLQSRESAARTDSIRAGAGVHRLENPRSRRLSPRAGAVVGRGLLHPRFRGRAGALHRRAAPQTIAAEGRRRHDPVLRLRGLRGAVRTHGVAPVRARAARTVGTHLADVDDAPRSCAGISRPRPARRSCRPSTRERDALLQLFVLDKALYELNYELNNRPDWVRIPLRGIFDLLKAGKR